MEGAHIERQAVADMIGAAIIDRDALQHLAFIQMAGQRVVVILKIYKRAVTKHQPELLKILASSADMFMTVTLLLADNAGEVGA